MANYSKSKERNYDKSDKNVRSKNYKRGSRNRSRIATVDTNSVQQPDGTCINNPNWYFTDSSLASMATAISFNDYLGSSLKVSPVDSIDIPTFLKINLNPSVGLIPADAPIEAGINMQGVKIYSTLSSYNAKTTNYAPQDVTALILAFGNVLENISYIKRFFGIAFSYNQRNRFYPVQILEALGVNSDDFLSHIADYRLKFNTTINLLNQIPVPANIAYLDKCASLYDNIYLDQESSMAQTFAYVPQSFWRVVENLSEQGTVLQSVDNPGRVNKVTCDNLLTILKDQINSILMSSTFNYIYSDVLNYSVKTGAQVYSVNIIPEDYRVLPIYSAEALLQLKNLRLIGNPIAQTSPEAVFTNMNDVWPDVNKNCLKYNPVFKVAGNHATWDSLLDFPTSSPDTAQIIEASRLVCSPIFFNKSADAKPVYTIAQVVTGDHYPVSLTIYKSNSFDSSSCYGPLEQEISGMIPMLTQFNGFPHTYWPSAPTGDAKCYGIAGDLNFYTTVSTEYLRRVNDLTFQGLFELRH